MWLVLPRLPPEQATRLRELRQTMGLLPRYRPRHPRQWHLQPAAASLRPQPLSTGYAVLVDYNYQPEMARTIQRQVGQAVALAVFRQRPYLLIAYSPNLEGAASTMSVLGALASLALLSIVARWSC